MPNYKVVDADVLDADLQTVADAIKAKAGTEEALEFPSGFASAVESIKTGGGGDTSVEDGLITGTLTEYTNDRVEQIRESLFEGFPLTKITLNNVVDCQQYAFEKCAELKEVNMPNLERFGSSCFNGCTSLEYINFPKLTSRLNSPNQTSEFYNCTSLKQCLIPNYGAALCSMFNGCSNLELVEVGGIGLNASSSYAKAFNNCAKLTTLIFRSATMIALPNMSHFNGTPFASGGTGGTVYVPAALIEQYQTATNWSTLYAAGTCNFVAIEGSEYE